MAILSQSSWFLITFLCPKESNATIKSHALSRQYKASHSMKFSFFDSFRALSFLTPYLLTLTTPSTTTNGNSALFRNQSCDRTCVSPMPLQDAICFDMMTFAYSMLYSCYFLSQFAELTTYIPTFGRQVWSATPLIMGQLNENVSDSGQPKLRFSGVQKVSR